MCRVSIRAQHVWEEEEEGGRIGQRVKAKGTGGGRSLCGPFRCSRADRTHQSCPQGSVAMPLHPCREHSFNVARKLALGQGDSLWLSQKPGSCHPEGAPGTQRSRAVTK